MERDLAKKTKWIVYYDLSPGGHGGSKSTIEGLSESDAAANFRRLHDKRAIIHRVIPA